MGGMMSSNKDMANKWGGTGEQQVTPNPVKTNEQLHEEINRLIERAKENMNSIRNTAANIEIPHTSVVGATIGNENHVFFTNK